MKVLVAYASKHGSTKGMADFIGEKLRQRGLDVDVFEVNEVQNLGAYDAFVLGSAVYFGHWMKEAKEFTSRNRSILSTRPVWLFSSGPTGKETKDAKGRDLLDPSLSGPLELEELKEGLGVKDHRVFFGALDTNRIGFFLSPTTQVRNDSQSNAGRRLPRLEGDRGLEHRDSPLSCINFPDNDQVNPA